MTKSMLLAGALLAHLAVRSAAEETTIYWGDLHAHTMHSDDAFALGNRVGAPGALRYARDTAHLDFVALTDHGEFLTEDEWSNIQAAVNRFNVPGEFVTLVAFEWTNEGGKDGGGHKNVYFRSDAAPARAIGAFPTRYGSPVVTIPTDLWTALAPYACFTVPHHPAKGEAGPGEVNMSTDWSYVNAAKQTVVEIYSKHGNSERPGCEEPVADFVDEGSVRSALLRWFESGDPGYKLGIIGSTDDHLSRPGSVAELPENVIPKEGPYTGGLVAVMAAAKTREAIFDAILARRVYATSGARIALSFKATAGSSEAIMGGTQTMPASSPLTLSVAATGDGGLAIARIELIRGKTGGEEVVAATDSLATLEFTDLVTERAYYRVKVFQVETMRVDGVPTKERAWSSPIWVEISK
ncbi:MAG: DUF3604 domain-containing protein [Planctomycetes bacterium]|nr:DUF3604 domain-containing protein [Planctomycetota bacterium]